MNTMNSNHRDMRNSLQSSFPCSWLDSWAVLSTVPVVERNAHISTSPSSTIATHTDLGVSGVEAELILERVIPYVFHIIPVPYDAVFHRVVDLQHRP